MEHLGQWNGGRAVVGFCFHERLHRFPPSLAHRGVGDGLPPGFGFNLRIGEELVGLRMMKNRVTMNAMGSENRFEFWPDWLVAPTVFLQVLRVHLHDKGFANHRVDPLLVVLRSLHNMGQG